MQRLAGGSCRGPRVSNPAWLGCSTLQCGTFVPDIRRSARCFVYAVAGWPGAGTIDYYRRANIGLNMLLYPLLLRSTPRHSHSKPSGSLVTRSPWHALMLGSAEPPHAHFLHRLGDGRDGLRQVFLRHLA